MSKEDIADWTISLGLKFLAIGQNYFIQSCRWVQNQLFVAYAQNFTFRNSAVLGHRLCSTLKTESWRNALDDSLLALHCCWVSERVPAWRWMEKSIGVYGVQ